MSEETNHGHQCDCCNYVANKQNTLDIHYYHHHAYQPGVLKCPNCEFYASDKTTITKHQNEYCLMGAKRILWGLRRLFYLLTIYDSSE